MKSKLFYKKKGLPKICDKGLEEVPIEQLLKGYENKVPFRAFKDELVSTASKIQGLAKSIKVDENSRNDIMAAFLSSKGFFIKDQTRWGLSATGKSIGQVDFKVELPGNGYYAICEAFRLKDRNKGTIDSHLEKLFTYDPSGVKENFIIVYAETANFSVLWKKYLNYIEKIDFSYPLQSTVEEEPVQFTDIKLARTRHKRQGAIQDVYHLFINMSSRQSNIE